MSGADPVVVDLGAVGRASVALARWYRGLLATGEGNVDELRHARADLAALPAQGGRLGWAVQLVVAGGHNASDDEIVAAIVLLSDAARRAAPESASATPAPTSGGRRRRGGAIQPSLPGLGP